MGASAWASQVPYQPDIAAALQLARWEAYRAGDYYRQAPLHEARTMTGGGIPRNVQTLPARPWSRSASSRGQTRRRPGCSAERGCGQ